MCSCAFATCITAFCWFVRAIAGGDSLRLRHIVQGGLHKLGIERPLGDLSNVGAVAKHLHECPQAPGTGPYVVREVSFATPAYAPCQEHLVDIRLFWRPHVQDMIDSAKNLRELRAASSFC